ncbi:MAG: excinuclease ABC subunit UvrC [Bacteroidales bacterium]|nr:excinuclease ABC subunit UvrC [Bacteroidales bacterium]
MDPREAIRLFPHSPGVYRYYDAAGSVIYVGKAKDLHKRVAQYFVAPERLTKKTAILVSHIARAEYTVVGSEADALLLENNLIKQYKPKYNILLKDSKTYPWICVSNESFPRIFLTRRVEKSGKNRYFGPYSSVKHAYSLLDLFFSLYPLRGADCKLKITSDGILHRKYRPCLKLHTGTCAGCCVGKVSEEEYGIWVEAVSRLLQGDAHRLIREYKAEMAACAEQLDFERAQRYKQWIDTLQAHYSRSIIVGNPNLSADVFALVFDEDQAYGNFLRVKGGSIIQSLNLRFQTRIEESREDVLAFFIGEIEDKFGALSKEVIVPFPPGVDLDGVQFTTPSRGDKLALLQLASRNAAQIRIDALKQSEHTDPDAYYERMMAELRDALGMKVLPEHIECFDNSNLQGTNPVAACVVFRGGKPSKKDYRHFCIKTVVGANDFASMKEIVNRRYSRLMAEAPDDLPQLIVIDGGKGQLGCAWEALCELGIQDRLMVVGLAKWLEEVVRVNDPVPLFLDRNSLALKLMQQARDEAHRFNITHHRLRRSKAQIHSVLRDIKGVGEKMEQKLLLRFGSVARIAAASEEEIAQVAGPALAAAIKQALGD